MRSGAIHYYYGFKSKGALKVLHHYAVSLFMDHGEIFLFMFSYLVCVSEDN